MRHAVILFCCLFCARVALGEELPASVAHQLKLAGIPQSAVGIHVQAVDADKPRLSLNATTPMNPASVIKLATTFAALERLGPAFTWETEAWTDGKLKDDVLEGDLYLKGSGDPKLTYEQFWRLLRQVRQRGIGEIRGDLVLDRSVFDVGEVDPGRFDGQPMRPYNVAPDGLLVNFNAITLTLAAEAGSDSVTLMPEPSPANLDIVNRLKAVAGNACGDWREALRADVFNHGGSTRLVLSGNYPVACGDQRWNLVTMDPARHAFGIFRGLWSELGGRFGGGLREGRVPDAARRVAALKSPSLAEVVRDINKFSNNVMARQLLLTLGAASGARPARVADGQAAMREWLDSQGLDAREVVIDNGSGLSRQTRISAGQLGRLLRAAWRSPVMPELVSSLPISAVDGTMRKRLNGNGVAGQAHIKTGTLEGVKAIAGYLLDQGGRRWIVVCIVNHPRASAAQATQDALLQWVYAR